MRKVEVDASLDEEGRRRKERKMEIDISYKDRDDGHHHFHFFIHKSSVSHINGFVTGIPSKIPI